MSTRCNITSTVMSTRCNVVCRTSTVMSTRQQWTISMVLRHTPTSSELCTCVSLHGHKVAPVTDRTLHTTHVMSGQCTLTLL